jgi:hypothetical protein
MDKKFLEFIKKKKILKFDKNNFLKFDKKKIQLKQNHRII